MPLKQCPIVVKFMCGTVLMHSLQTSERRLSSLLSCRRISESNLPQRESITSSTDACRSVIAAAAADGESRFCFSEGCPSPLRIIQPHSSSDCTPRPTRWDNWRACYSPSVTQPCDTVRLDREWNLEVGALERVEFAHHSQNLRGSGSVFGEVPYCLSESSDKLDHLQLTPTSMTKACT